MAKRIKTFYLTDEVIEVLEERARGENVSVSFIMENLARAYCDLPQTFSTLIEAVKKASPKVVSEMDSLKEERETRLTNQHDRAMKSLHETLYYTKEYETGAYKRNERLPSQEVVEATIQKWVDKVFPKDFLLEISFEEALKEVKKLEDTAQLLEKNKLEAKE